MANETPAKPAWLNPEVLARIRQIDRSRRRQGHEFRPAGQRREVIEREHGGHRILLRVSR